MLCVLYTSVCVAHSGVENGFVGGEEGLEGGESLMLLLHVSQSGLYSGALDSEGRQSSGVGGDGGV